MANLFTVIRMEEFFIVKPSSLLAPYVKHYWLLKTPSNSAAFARTVPTGQMSLIFHRGNRLFSVRNEELHPRVFLGGQEKSFADLEYSGQVNMITVVFRPTGVRAFFHFPLNIINDIRVTAGDMEDKELTGLERLIVSEEDDRLCITLIEQFLTTRLKRLAGYNAERIDTAIRMIHSGQHNIVRLADSTCLSTKQFQRIFSEYVGSNPKEFTRTIRFQRALQLLENNPNLSLTSLTYECGYYDQSHLIKEFKALSGYTPAEYMAVCEPHSDYFY